MANSASPLPPALMMAGPAELRDATLAALGQQVSACVGASWVEQHGRTLELLSTLLGVAEPPYLIPGSGTTGLDGAIGNLFEPGQRVVVADTGFFGRRLAEIARAHRLHVLEVPVEVGAPIDPQRLAAALAEGAEGVLAVHVETSTGVRHPIEDLAVVVRERGALFLVDGIASAGGESVRVDAMGIDCLVTSPQKGLEAPPGLGIIALGPRGRARVRARAERPATWFLDLRTWDWYRGEWAAWHPHPVTMPTNLVQALQSSLEQILESGLDEWIGRRAALARRCREGLRDLGLEPVPREGAAASLIVAAYTDEADAIQRHLLEHGIRISGGLPPLQGRAIRIGLMGRTATGEMVDRVLELIGEVVRARSAARG